MKSMTDWKAVNNIWGVSENFWLNLKFKLNIIDRITDGRIKNINI